MTTLRQSVIEELKRVPEDKLNFVIQIMQGINGLFKNEQLEKKAFEELELLRKKGTTTDDSAKLTSYKEEKYGLR